VKSGLSFTGTLATSRLRGLAGAGAWVLATKKVEPG
jgi:hypothetical protein